MSRIATISAALALSLTLGAGGDTVTFTGGGNIAVATAAKFDDHEVTIEDFNTAQDTMDLTGRTLASQNLIDGAVDGAATLFAALEAAAGAMNAGTTAAQFVYGGDLYIYIENGGFGTVDAGDGYIKLAGVSETLTEGVNLIV